MLGAYDKRIIEEAEGADVSMTGLRRSAPASFDCFTTETSARRIAKAMARRSVHIRNTYRFSTHWRFCLLEPMDLVTLTVSFGTLVLDHLPVRITEVVDDPQA